MALALIERDRPDLLRPRPLAIVGGLMVVAGIAALDMWPPALAEDLAALPIVLGAVALMGSTLRWRPKVGSSVMALAADASYPFYLWHAPVLAVVASTSTGYPALAAGFAIAAAASLGSVLLVERPFLRSWNRSRAGRRNLSPTPNRPPAA
jgi:peptidoglycan/LPS O-acetylase OafA/YrhL